MRSERLMEMEKYICDRKNVSLTELCQSFHISMGTVRRDVKEMVKHTNIKKTYGGVTVDSGNRRELISYDERTIREEDSKRKIAAKAASYIDEGDVVFIDSGTTTVHILDYLAKKHVTVITNNLNILLAALPMENITVIGLAGTLRKKTLSFTGATAAASLKQFNFNKAFMAATGISVIGGVTNSSSEETCVKEIAIAKSRERYLLVDSSKFGVLSMLTYCKTSDLDGVITEQAPSAKMKEYLRKEKVDLIYA